jgi:DNA polymerase-4/DNA polymerase IV (DinB-like DNA polymerase)
VKLTCSVGLAYSKTAAKTASEEKKPDGYYEIPSASDFVRLIQDRDVRVLASVGQKTAEKLHRAGIHTVRDVQERQQEVMRLLGKQGRWIVQVAYGIDDRPVTPYRPEDAKSIGRELTFQEDVEGKGFLREVLFLLSLSVESRARRVSLCGRGVSLKLTYANMRSITRSRALPPCDDAVTIYREAVKLLDQVDPAPVRLIGVSLYNLSGEEERQLSFADLSDEAARERQAEQEKQLNALQEHYHLDFAGHLEELRHTQTLHRTVEYMRKHR